MARLAGLPDSLLKRADEILGDLEVENPGMTSSGHIQKKDIPPLGNDLFTNQIIEELKKMDVMSQTPIEAMEILFRLSRQAKEGSSCR